MVLRVASCALYLSSCASKYSTLLTSPLITYTRMSAVTKALSPALSRDFSGKSFQASPLNKRSYSSTQLENRVLSPVKAQRNLFAKDAANAMKRAVDVSQAKLKFKRVSDKATIPKRGTIGSAGYDLSSVEDVVIKPGGRHAVDTGLKVYLPIGTYGRVAPRSGLAFRFGIDTLAGVIDGDYRGIVKVILQNHGDKDFTIKTGDRIAQLVLEYIATPEPEEVFGSDEEEEDTKSKENVKENNGTKTTYAVRGTGGFGSTGGFTEQK